MMRLRTVDSGRAPKTRTPGPAMTRLWTAVSGRSPKTRTPGLAMMRLRTAASGRSPKTRAPGPAMVRLRLTLRSALLWLAALIVLVPLLMTLGASFMGESELMEHIRPVIENTSGQARATLLPGLPTLEQYVMLLFDTPKFLTMFWNSMSLVLPMVLGQVAVGTLAAWGFAHFRFPLRNGLFMGYIALMMMPFQVTLVPSYLVLDYLKLVNTRWAVILPGVFGTFSVFLLRQFFVTIPDSLLEAARIDGAGEARVFMSIALPLGRTGIASLFILSFLDNWNLIEQPMTFLRSQDRWPLSLYLTRIGESNVDVAMAASIIALLPTMLLFFYCESYLVRGIQMSGLKE